MTRPLRSAPITGTSSLLRAGPPASPAPVLGPSRFLPLGTLPFSTLAGHNYRDPPSPVPRESSRSGSRRLHAGHHLASKRVSARSVLEPYLHPQFCCHLNTFLTRHHRFACTRLPAPHLTP